MQILDAAGWPLDVPIAEALHVGLVTDTGRLSYSNATPAALRADARFVETGIDVAAIARRLYENLPIEQARLMGIVYSKAQMLLDGKLVVAVLELRGLCDRRHRRRGRRRRGAPRRSAGPRSARSSATCTAGALRASLRAASDRVDVSADRTRRRRRRDTGRRQA